MSWPVIMHINHFEQGQTLEEACKGCAEIGFDGIEFRRKRTGMKETAEEYLDTVSRLVDKYNIGKVIFGSPGLQKHSGTRAEQEAELEEMIKFYELACSRFKLEICNTFAGPIMNPAKGIPYEEYTRHGSFTATEENWNWAVESFKALGKVAEKLGFVFAFETHFCYLNDTVEATMKLVNEINSPAVGVNLDYGNIIYFENPISIRDALDTAGDKLYYVHVKNSRGKGLNKMNVALSEGDINHRTYLKRLQKMGYKGPICIENPRLGDRIWYAKQDLAYLRQVISEL